MATRMLQRLLRLFITEHQTLHNLVDTASKRVITTDQLSLGALKDLFELRAGAVHVKAFYSPILAQKLSETILAFQRRNWSVSHVHREQEKSDVETIDIPHNVAVAEGKLQEYFDSSIAATRRLRNCLDGQHEYMGPIDKLRLELDEIWVDGCNVERDKHSGKPFVAGMVRIMSPAYQFQPGSWKRGFIHVDELDIMSSKRGLFSANLYLQKPPMGGDLNIWPLAIKSRMDFYKNAHALSLLLVQDKRAQTELFSKLPEPITISPQAGDLVLLCTQRPHAVNGPIYGDDRVSVQCFIQYNKGKPLKLES